MDIVYYRRFLADHFPQLQVWAATEILEGWDSFVLEVNNEFIFRFPRGPLGKVQQQKEIALLSELSKALSLPIPQFEFIHQGDRFEECAVGYRKIHGLPLSKELTSSAQVASHLGKFLFDLHNFPVNRAVQLNVPKFTGMSWRKKYLDFYTSVQENISSMMSPQVSKQMDGLWEGFLDTQANFQFQPVLIHGDLGEDHILCDPRRGFISGIIDWGDAVIGDPALDFVGLLNVGGQTFAERVFHSYQGNIEPNFWEKISFYHQIIPFYEIQYGLLTRDKRYIQTGLQRFSNWNLCTTQ